MILPVFSNLSKLEKHLKFLKQILKDIPFFLVWWAIRDLLLDIETQLDDIDLTAKGNPKEIFEIIKNNIKNLNNISIFQTEKFWTITLVNKNNNTKYELTPLREEWQYLDFRHPKEIIWTDSVVKDSIRRDFTINAMYFTIIENINLETSYLKFNILKDSRDKTKLEKFTKLIKEKENLLINQGGKLIFLVTNEKLVDSFLKINTNKLIDSIQNAEKISLEENLENKIKNLYIILDPQKWILDLIDWTIRAVWNPDNRFQEDALRIIRWIRFAIILNEKIRKRYSNLRENRNSKEKPPQQYRFDFDTETWRSMKKNYYLVKFVAKERVKEEILRIFKNSDNPFGFIALMDELNILKYFFPYLWLTKWVNQPVRYHPLDTYHHILLTFYHFQKINKDYLARFWMLYHDVAKPDQYYYTTIWLTPEERKKMHWSYIHHPNQWVDFVKEDFKKLWFSSKEIEEIAWYVKHHMKPGEWLRGKEKTVVKNLKKYLAEYGYRKTKNLLDICIADRLGQYNPLQSPEIEWLQWMKKKLDEIYALQWQFSKKDLAINGYDIMKHFNLQPGPIIWKLIDAAFEWVVENPEERNKKEKILEYLEKINQS